MTTKSRPFCAGANPEIFFDEDHIETAKAYCRRCSVVEWCLTRALSISPAPVGVWGGTTEDERVKIKRGGARRTCPGCGSQEIFSDGSSKICINCGISWLM